MASIRKRGKSWEVQVRGRGLPSVTKTFKSRKTAEIWARQTEQEIERTGLVIDRERLRKTSIRDLCTRYEREVSPKKRAGDREVYFLRIILRDPLSNTALDAIRPQHVATYRDKRLKQVGPAAVCRELALLRHMFEVARRDWGYQMSGNPVKDVRMPRLPEHRTRRTTAEELEHLLTLARQSPNPLLEPVITLAVETGMRRGELVAALWEDLNLKDGTLFLPMTKNGHSRLVPLSPAAISVLKKLPRTDERIIPLTGNAVRLSWTRLTKKAKVEDLHFHDLRHEAISRFFEKGLSIAEIAAISGHRDFRMLFRYTHPRATDIARKLATYSIKPQ